MGQYHLRLVIVQTLTDSMMQFHAVDEHRKSFASLNEHHNMKMTVAVINEFFIHSSKRDTEILFLKYVKISLLHKVL